MARLRVHALCDPTAAARALPAVRPIVLAALGATDAARHAVAIGASSGWLQVRLRGELWERATPPVLPDGPAARRRAEQAIARLAAACCRANPQWPAALAPVALLPRQWRPADLAIVPHTGGPREAAWRGADHWLYRAQPVLPVDEDRRRLVPVLGTMVAVRIGHAGQVVAVSAQWRAPSGEQLLVDAAAPPAPHDDEAAHGHASPADPAADDVLLDADAAPPPADGAPPRHVYVLDGAHLPQHYLAPYLQVADHHGAGLASGCAWALTVALGREQRSDGMRITAEVRGGSGDYRFAWASHRLDAPDAGLQVHAGHTLRVDTPDGPQLLGAVLLPDGARVLMVQVQDRATGAFRHVQQLVFSHPLARPGTDTGTGDADPMLA